MGLKDLFWSSGGDKGKPEKVPKGAAPSEDDADAIIKKYAGSSPPATSAAAAAPDPASAGDSLMNADPAAVYAKTGTVGDPNADIVLSMFADMSTNIADTTALGVAINASIKGIKADPASIVATLEKRLAAIDSTVADETRRVSEGNAKRDAMLDELKTLTAAKIDELKKQIAEFEKGLADSEIETKNGNAADQGKLMAFTQNMTQEAKRLNALKSFLASLAASKK